MWHAGPGDIVMKAIRQILVPSDFSESSRKALDYAAEFARPFAASVDVLHVWEAPIFIPPAGILAAGVVGMTEVEIFRKSAQDALDRFVADARARGVVVRASFAELGPPAHTITEFARKREYDLIVIGTHGRTGLSHAWIGSVAERVVRHAPCMVLTVREPSDSAR